jgi:hypothetical protein
MKPDKVIITNRKALQTKYGANFPLIEKAILRLIAADKKRGIETKLMEIDSATQMAEVHYPEVRNQDDQEQVKAAVDVIYKAYKPDYIMLLGAPDILPHQDLRNPTYDPDGDSDKLVPSDVPYACEAAYSTDPTRFLGPTRVVGRLPDLQGKADAGYLVSLLGTAARHKTRSRSEFQKYFSVSAEVWKSSTALSLTKVFGANTVMTTSPPKGPAWTEAQLRPRMHFINCHGAPSDPYFYGQRGNQYPKAHSAKQLQSKISNGTVIAAECCYGAELYDPADSTGQAGICSAYLRDGAYGYFGSSTIAYGPSEGNGQADLICQYFLNEVLDGASLGEAALRARHRFAQAYTHLDPTDLKTLIQFNLLGDPAIHAVAAVPHALVRTKAFRKAFQPHQNSKATRGLRRERSMRVGTHLQAGLGAAIPVDEILPGELMRALETAAKETGIRSFGKRSFRVQFPQQALKGDMVLFAGDRESRRIYMLSGRRPVPKEAPGHVVSLVATVQNGQLIHMRRIHSR